MESKAKELSQTISGEICKFISCSGLLLKGKVPFFVAIAVMLAIAFVMAQPQTMLFLLFLVYAVSGPVVTLVARRRRARSKIVKSA